MQSKKNDLDEVDKIKQEVDSRHKVMHIEQNRLVITKAQPIL